MSKIMVECPYCGGSGCIVVTQFDCDEEEFACHVCDGTGEIEEDDDLGECPNVDPTAWNKPMNFGRD